MTQHNIYVAATMLLTTVLLASCGGGGGGAAGGNTTGNTMPAYPLKASANGRYLVDQNNAAFLLVGDAPQALMVNISESDAAVYFANRAKRGFNAVWINLLCDTYTGGRSDSSTFDGVLPFNNPGDLSTPNETYFSHCDRVINLAAKYGLVVFLDPAETGGFIQLLIANGPQKCSAYGQYLGNRYKNFNNIVWMSGNDFQNWSDPTSDAAASAVAVGIKQLDNRHMQTVELEYFLSSSTDDPVWAGIVSLNGAYTYFPTYAEVLQAYNRSPNMPVFMEEADYEFENGADPQRLRREEYWSVLSGATGELYGNHYIWPFLSGWQNELDTPGAIQLGYAKALLLARPWYSLIPDQQHVILTTGFGTFSSGGSAHSSISSNDYAAVAATPDGRLVMAYIPSARTFTIDMTKLSAPTTARWFDPTSGAYSSAASSTLQNVGTRSFTSPGLNAEGGSSSDWVLLLEVKPA